jgi:hypothetical protein
VYSKSLQWFLDLEKQNCASFEDLVQSLPENVSVYTATVPANLPFTFHDSPVACLEWIPLWPADMIHMCHYIQLDTSSRAVKPGVQTLPLATKANLSFPLALIVGISESLELYRRFYDGILRIASEHAEPTQTDI